MNKQTLPKMSDTAAFDWRDPFLLEDQLEELGVVELQVCDPPGERADGEREDADHEGPPAAIATPSPARVHRRSTLI